jgi:hypothetical protein
MPDGDDAGGVLEPDRGRCPGVNVGVTGLRFGGFAALQ